MSWVTLEQSLTSVVWVGRGVNAGMSTENMYAVLLQG